MIGQTLGHYRIDAKLGEGGMGVVYRATDIRLGRRAAVKVLRGDAMTDPERRKRFEQEAKAASALNHPNIITIYEIDTVATAGGPVDFMAMEYIEGKTLGHLIGRKGLRLGETLKYAVQIADALAKAHAPGIVHRDLKPANVMVTGDGLVKVLDFGLAKLTEVIENDPLAATRTVEADALRTEEGTILGTVAYMSPEQAEGKKVDVRSDIFSFGSVLYEMTAGRPAFLGQTKIATLSAILHQEPKPLSESGEAVPYDLEKIVARCLRKDPERRFQHMSDVKIALLELKEESESGRARPGAGAPGREDSKKRTPAAAAAILLVAALLVAASVGVTWWLTRRANGTRGLVLTKLTADSGLTTQPAISLDGKLVAYASDRAAAPGPGGNLDIWVQQVSGGQAIRLTRHPADDGEPSFSPDGSTVAFRSEREGGGVYVVSTLGGDEKLIARQGRRPRFSPDGAQIAYWVGATGGAPTVQGTSKIYAVASTGGPPQPLQTQFAAARYPLWSPDGKRVLFWGISDPQVRETDDWWVTPLDGGAASKTGALAVFRKHGLGSQPGAYMIIPAEWAALGDRVLFSAQSGDSTNLWQLRVSPRNGQVEGAPQRLTSGSGLEVQPAAAPGGAIVFSSLRSSVEVWKLPVDTDRAKVAGPMQKLTDSGAAHPYLSANGKTVVFLSRRAGKTQVWLKNLESSKETYLALAPSSDGFTVISPDGSKAAYGAAEKQKPAVYVASAEAGIPEKVCDDCTMAYSFSSDGKKLLFWSSPGQTACISLLDLASGEQTEILRRSGYGIFRATFSPDDRWIAFHALNRPGRSAVFVVPFRGAAPIQEQEWIPITDNESYDFSVAWSPDGGILYYLSERDGFRCVWGQRLNPATKRPAGPPFSVQDFHNATRSMIPMVTNWLRLSASRDMLVFNLAETGGNVWMAR